MRAKRVLTLREWKHFDPDVLFDQVEQALKREGVEPVFWTRSVEQAVDHEATACEAIESKNLEPLGRTPTGYTATANFSPIAAKYRWSVDSFTSPPASRRRPSARSSSRGGVFCVRFS